jgi:transcriptional regulator with XRE-family HTH domain
MTEGQMMFRAWVRENDVKQADICRATGIKPPVVCKILKGTTPISLRSATAIAGYTGLPVEKLVNPKYVLVVRKYLEVA